MAVKVYKDPIYDYIEIDSDYFSNYIDTPEFQRLQHVRQTGYVPLYASATHNRFCHSIGVFYLGQLAFRAFSENIDPKIKRDIDIDRLGKAFLKACLLHDIGHAPFSHTGENYFRNGDNLEVELIALIEDEIFAEDCKYYSDNAAGPHELMSAIVGLKAFEDTFSSEDEKSFFVRCVTGYGYRESSEEKLGANGCGVRNAIISLLNSKTIDVDKLDYLMRDAYFAGYKNTPIDYKRLLAGVSLMEYKAEDGSLRYCLAYKKSAMSALVDVVYAKDFEVEWVQNHPVIIYEQFLDRQVIKTVGEVFFGSVNELFCSEAISYEGKTLKDARTGQESFIRLLSDDDIVSRAKQIKDDRYITEFFDRRMRLKPVWKSEAEFKALFKLSDMLGNEGCDSFVEAFKTLEKYLNEIAGFPIASRSAAGRLKEYVDDMGKEIAEMESNGDGNIEDYRNSYQSYSDALRLLEFIGSAARKSGCRDYEFLIITSKEFNSGFSTGRLEKTRIQIDGCETPRLLCDVVSLPHSQGSSGSFFYLFAKNKKHIDIEVFIDELMKGFAELSACDRVHEGSIEDKRIKRKVILGAVQI